MTWLRLAHPDLPDPFSRAEAAEAGLRRAALDEAVRLGDAVRVSHGLFSFPRTLDPHDESWERARADHLFRLRTALRRLPGHVASHTSAALLHGLPVVIAARSPVELTARDVCQRSWREDGLIVHHSDSAPLPVQSVDGLRVTTLPRTVADTLRTRSLGHGTALLDHVIRDGRATAEEVVGVLRGQKRWRGRPRALAAVTLSDPRRENWLESYSFVTLHERGVPVPLAQIDVFDTCRRHLGRVDGLLPESGIFLEADGQAKYFLDVDERTTPEQSVLGRLEAEAQRHSSIERTGLVGVRWTSDEIREDPDAVAGRVLAAQRGGTPVIRGYAEWQGELRRLPFSVDRPSVDFFALTERRRRRRAA